jgi:hypothetical protein
MGIFSATMKIVVPMYETMRHMINLPKGAVTRHAYSGGGDHKARTADSELLFVAKNL